MRQYDHGVWTDAQHGLVADALRALQKGDFFAAHEFFESVFRTSTGSRRLFFHGLAQIAASHHQLTLGRGRAAVHTWQKARTKLAAAGALTADFAQAMDALHARLGLTVEGPRFFDTRTLGSRQSFPLPTPDRLHIPSA